MIKKEIELVLPEPEPERKDSSLGEMIITGTATCGGVFTLEPEFPSEDLFETIKKAEKIIKKNEERIAKLELEIRENKLNLEWNNSVGVYELKEPTLEHYGYYSTTNNGQYYVMPS